MLPACVSVISAARNMNFCSTGAVTKEVLAVVESELSVACWVSFTACWITYNLVEQHEEDQSTQVLPACINSWIHQTSCHQNRVEVGDVWLQHTPESVPEWWWQRCGYGLGCCKWHSRFSNDRMMIDRDETPVCNTSVWLANTSKTWTIFSILFHSLASRLSWFISIKTCWYVELATGE